MAAFLRTKQTRKTFSARTSNWALLATLAFSCVAASDANADIDWETNLRSAHAQAQAEGKLLLLHFYSDNCTWCDKLEEGSFKAPQVGFAISKNFVPVKIHANSSPKLAAMFKVNKFPTDVIVTTEGKTLSHTVSPQNPDRYVTMLSSTLPALADANPTADPMAVVASQVTAPGAQPAPTYDNAVASSQHMPPYAALPYGTVPETSAPDLTLPDLKPDGALSGGASPQFAAARTESPRLEYPGNIAPQVPESAHVSAPEVTLPTLEAPATSEIPVASKTLNASPTAEGATVSAEIPTVGEVASVEQPELAMQGFCPVTVITEDKWVEGKPEFGVIHLGKLYLFTSEQHMTTFLADPVPYTPVLNEIDVVRFFEERTIVPGKREWGLKDPIHNRMFFFADEDAMNHFYNEYERYTDAAIEVMDRAVKDANPGT